MKLQKIVARNTVLIVSLALLVGCGGGDKGINPDPGSNPKI